MHRSTIQSNLLALAFAALASGQTNAATEAPATGVAMSPHTVAAATASAPQNKRPPTAPVKLVDINRAGRKELMTLTGVGTAEADKIIANRPYLTKTDLVAKQVLPIGPYLSLKHQIIALPKGRPNTKPLA